ncbi:multidrug resistance-associated ABC transporter [Pholiota conissans]|uniref:Multidrug resistance-associated ABC transporter n=1 Tax=Pholiota conissans TaxID=109636 RepID=A0A9P5ZA05_9AGAR|nr:multidrug resistance-associated ABC transporter [Pholiota conissans]
MSSLDMSFLAWNSQLPLVDKWNLAEYLETWQPEVSVPRDTLVIPFTVAFSLSAIHALYKFLMFLKTYKGTNFNETDSVEESYRPSSFSEIVHDRVISHGGWTIYSFAIVRLIGCIMLLLLSSITLRRHLAGMEVGSSQILLYFQCPESYICMTFLYSSILSLAALVIKKRAAVATTCNVVVLLVAFLVYTYRDIWPLATYTEVPMDLSEGHLLWLKLTILFGTAVLIPLFVPNRYTPIGPKNPMPFPNPEQTTSLFSLLSYSYLSPIISLGSYNEHVGADQFPPLCDSDASEHLVKKSFSHLDPFRRKPRHIFFGLAHIFGRDYALMASILIVMVVTDFLSPISIYRILKYLEKGEASDGIRPWFWVLALFAGPMLSAVAFQWYIFLVTKVLVHAEAILTELVFEHSLRIRFTAETKEISDKVVAGSDGQRPSGSQPTEHQASSKGKSRANSSATPATASTVPKKKKKAANLQGKINNLITTDLTNITRAREILYLVLTIPLQICLCIVFLYNLLGWSSLVGSFCMILLMPIPGYTAKLLQDVQHARVQAVTEIVNALRMIKLFGWEEKMSKRIQDTRDEELEAIWVQKILSNLTGVINSLIPTITMLVTYSIHTAIMKQELTPSIIFSSLTVFDKLRSQLFGLSRKVNTFTQGRVSLDRYDEFLKTTELLDAFVRGNSEASQLDEAPGFNKDIIGFENASFVWSLENRSLSQPSYQLRIRDKLFFKPNCINLIVGPTGSGKTSILMALLGEMHFIREGSDSWFNLPRDGGVAFAAQESWVQNETIRANILFGYPYNEARYKKVLYQCALNRDLALFEAGDNTEVGEKGITLSGGQKARVTLARAIYSPTKIILLDDVLAALDVHTATWVVENCLKGDLVKDRTIILVSHNVALVSPLAKFIISLGQDGDITSRDPTIDTALDNDPLPTEEVNHASLRIAGQEVQSFSKKELSMDGKLVLAEEVAKGHVTWKSLRLFLSGLGGKHPILFFGFWIYLIVLYDSTSALHKWFLGYWGSQYQKRDPSEIRVSFFCAVYVCIVVLSITVFNAASFFYAAASIKASRTINTLLVSSVLRSTLRWLDQTPTARIITRFTQDIQMVDGSIANGFRVLILTSVDMATYIGVIMLFTPVFSIPGVIVGVLGFRIGNMYLKTQLSAMREKSNARSPVLAHLSAAIAGIVSIRAYGAQEAFKNESLQRINKHIRMARVTYNLNRWVALRIDFLGDLFKVGLAAYLVYGKSIGASNTGLSLNMATQFCSTILLFVRIFNDFEVESNSLERIQGYLDIDHEEESSDAIMPPAAWPTSGDLRVENLTARYSQNGPTILHDLSFHIESGQRVGIVGRTGSGKSSLTLALLRCILTEGTVYYDDIPTNRIKLDALRSNITIIPQTPELISGTLRRNLDPFEQYDDAILNDALRSAGLFTLQEELGEARITLDSNISIGGGNLSVGEKQILTLARAIIRGSKLLILDEATSAIDYKTDSVIQTTLRQKLDADVTVITVAHRLQTIMDADKIMVLDDGRISEFDAPSSLLQREGSLFKALVDGSSDKDALYDAVKKKHIASSSTTFVRLY